MEENIPAEPQPAQEEPVATPPAPAEEKKHLMEVVTVRNWKEYLGESMLIVFSVLLALGLTEYFDSRHEKQQAKEILHELREEITKNKESEEMQYKYHLQVLQHIDSALHNPAFAAKVIDSGFFHLEYIAKEGVMFRDLNSEIWQIAQQNNVLSRIDLRTYELLTEIYAHQLKITNAEDKIGAVLLSQDSRKPENRRATLILMRDNYKGWAVDRAPGLIMLYGKAIELLKDY